MPIGAKKHRTNGRETTKVKNGVEKVYDAFCAETGLTPEAAIDENPDTKPQKEPITVKKVFSAILDYLSVSMFSVAPVLMAGGLFRCITVIFGPNMLNLMAADSNLYVALTAVYNEGQKRRKAGLQDLRQRFFEEFFN